MKQKWKKIGVVCLMLALVILAGVSIWLAVMKNRAAKTTETETAQKNVLDIEWYDEKGKEFTLTTAKQLIEFSKLSDYYDFAGQTIKLGADIVVNEGNAADWEAEVPEIMWDAIGGFAGTFDGQGHTISGICCYGQLYRMTFRPKADYYPAGLFRFTQEGCVIKNFKLVNSFFKGDLSNGAGAISSCGSGTFDSIYTDATILNYKNFTGGILGRTSNKGEKTIITNCWFDGVVRVEGGFGAHIGGMVGRVMEKDTCTVEHCLNTGTISSDAYKKGVQLGGLVGQCKDSTLTISDCLAAGELKNEWKNCMGSVIGNVVTGSNCTITDVYATKECWNLSVGVVLGTLDGYPVAYPQEKLKGVGGYEWTTLDFDKYWVAVPDGIPVLKTFAKDTVSCEGAEKKMDTSWYNEEEKTYVLKDEADFYGFSVLSATTTFEGKTIKLAANLKLNNGNAANWAKQAPENEWMPIGSVRKAFEGTFDGQKHTISGVYLKAADSYNGLFRVIGTKGKVKNFSLKNSYFEASAASFGSIAGRCRGSLDTVYSDAIVVSDRTNLGGLIGQVPADGKVTLNNCWFAGKVANKTNQVNRRGVGGLIGTNLSNPSKEWKGEPTKITNCLFTGTVDVSTYTAKNTNNNNVAPGAGGIVGMIGNKSNVDISYSLSTGTIRISKKANVAYGLVIGYLSSGKARLSQVYASDNCKEVWISDGKNLDGEITVYDQSKLNGYAGYQWTALDFNKYWAVVVGPDKAPILKSFANRVPSLAGITRLMDTSWYQAKKDVYVLNDLADLNGFAMLSKNENFKGKTIKLGADIVANAGNAADWASIAPAYSWSPIGTTKKAFEGTFDGQGHTISGLYLKTTKEYGGLFGVIGTSAKVKNFSLKNSYFETSAASFGSIAGRCRGSLDTVYSDAIVVSDRTNVGGLIGQVPADGKVTLNNCWFAGRVTNKTNQVNRRGAGGLIGTNLSNPSEQWKGEPTKITNCLFTGTVDVSTYTAKNTNNNNVAPGAGGIVGMIGNKSKVDISYSLSTGTIHISEKANVAYGPVIGYLSSGNAVLSQVYASDTCKEVWVSDRKNLDGEITRYDQSKLNGYAGYQWTTLDFDNYWAVVVGPDKAPILRSFADRIPSLNGIARLMDTRWYDEKKDTYEIKTLAELNGLAALSVKTNFAGKTIKLGADITANTGNAADWQAQAPAYTWTPIGTNNRPFAGTFDGQMHTISGIYLKTTDRDSGLFGNLGKSAVVKNFSLKNSYFETTAKSFGSVAGRLGGTVDTVYSDAIVVSSAENAGGLVGQVYYEGTGKAIIKNCWYAGTVTNTANAKAKRGTGGLVGANQRDSQITNCLFTGTVDTSAYHTAESATNKNISTRAGGFIGVNSNMGKADISDSLSAGTIKVYGSQDPDIKNVMGYGPVVGNALDGKVTLSQVYASDTCKVVWIANAGLIQGEVTRLNSRKLNGYAGYQWTTLDFDNYWAVVLDPDGTPILRSFANKIPSLDGVSRMLTDTSWYEKDKKEYVLDDFADLKGFAQLSKETDFKGKTVKLSADITANLGNAADWQAQAPLDVWSPIGPGSKPFEGTFDGQGHSISGIYLKTNGRDSGFFGILGNNAVVKNFSLKNSYFETTAKSFGSIAGRSRGTIDTVYSDAIVVSKAENVGGMVGQTYDESGGTAILNNCWYAGTVTNTANARGKRGTAAFIGSNSSNSQIKNCLFTGMVDVSAYSAKNANNDDVAPMAGGFVGSIGGKSQVDISDSLSIGTIKVHEAANIAYGPVIGYVNTGGVTLSQVYSYDYKEVYIAAAGAIKGEITVCTQSGLSGDAARESTKLDFDKYWAVVPEKAPILKSFADKK